MKKVTGRYNTRKEFEEKVLLYWTIPAYTQAMIARICRVFPSTVGRIIDEATKDGRLVKMQDEDLKAGKFGPV